MVKGLWVWSETALPPVWKGALSINPIFAQGERGMDNIARIDMGAKGGPKVTYEPVGEYAGLGDSGP